MPDQLIRHGRLETDSWQRVTPTPDADPAALPTGPILLPAPYWMAHREALQQRINEIGVSLAPTFPVEDLLPDLARLTLIAIEFPKFTDGRGYSTARLLRERYNYTGELRAVGDIGRDQLFFLHRVGFDAFLIPEGRDAGDALLGLTDYPDAYQAAVDQRLPHFRRHFG